MKIIHVLAILAFAQVFFSCQPPSEDALSFASGIHFQTSPVSCQAPEKAPAPTANLILQSVDGGQTWQDASAGLPADIRIRNLTVSGGEVFLNAERAPQPDASPEAFPKAWLFRSAANASPVAWESENGMFQPENIFQLFSGRNGLCAYNHQDGFSQKIAGLDSWMPIYQAQKGEWVNTLFEAADGAVFTGCVNGIFKSTDDGATWKNVYAKSQATHFASANGVLFADSYKGILRSTDGGEHWDWALQQEGMAFKTRQMEGGILAILNNNSPLRNQERLLASTDGGATWQDLDKNLPPSRLIFDARQAGKYLFCSLDSGLYRSADMGKTWELVLKVEGKAFQLAVSGQVVYAMFVEVGC